MTKSVVLYASFCRATRPEALRRLASAIHRRREPVSNWRVWWVEGV